ncbi:hypothetical protein [Candidatus Pelagibacter sp. HIMB1782]|uniref:hypothetical protein n=1 Tax=Candidatus Pelagibacter sp. HIMB1782 TaxID=3413375 RepID=UPI003F82AD9E
MKKIILILISILFLTSSYAGMSEDDKKKTIECAGIYYANSMIPQAELELEKITHSFAAKKFLSSYLVKDGVNEDNLNKELIKIVDERYGKPYEKNTTMECDSFVYKLIPNSKEEIDKLVKSGIY